MSIGLQQVRDAGVRLKVLQTLEKCGGYAIYADQLYEFLNDEHFHVAHEELMRNLQWLGKQKLVDLEQVGGLWLVTLLQHGLDVQAGRARAAGVARPRPGD